VIRRLVLGCAFCLSGALAFDAVADTRYALRAAQPVAATLGGGEPLAGVVVFVFQPEDCFGQGGLLERWDGLRKAGRLPVRGMVVGDGTLSQRQTELFRDLGVGIQLRGIDAMDAAMVAEKLGYRSTPFAVVLDARGRVAASYPAHQNVPPEVLRQFLAGP
jgi:hypothetical protein